MYSDNNYVTLILNLLKYVLQQASPKLCDAYYKCENVFRNKCFSIVYNNLSYQQAWRWLRICWTKRFFSRRVSYDTKRWRCMYFRTHWTSEAVECVKEIFKILKFKNDNSLLNGYPTSVCLSFKASSVPLPQ